jgi:hypothetical protein
MGTLPWHALDAAKRINAGTRMLHALAGLAQSWEDQADECASPTTAESLRECARQLREAVKQAHAGIHIQEAALNESVKGPGR